MRGRRIRLGDRRVKDKKFAEVALGMVTKDNKSQFYIA